MSTAYTQPYWIAKQWGTGLLAGHTQTAAPMGAHMFAMRQGLVRYALILEWAGSWNCCALPISCPAPPPAPGGVDRSAAVGG